MEHITEERWREAVAAALRAVRGEAGLSQAEMERRTGITRSSYNFYEEGKRSPTVVYLAAIASACGISFSRLVSEIERRARDPEWRP